MTRENYIKDLIKEKGYSVKSFAEHIGIPYSTLRSILSSGVGGASVDNAIRICQGLGITVDALNKCEAANNDFSLTEKEKILIRAYRSQPSIQIAVDRLLGIEGEEDKKKKRA